MFTGIVEATAAVLAKSASGLSVERPASFDDLKRGSSVCVSGVCLTVTDLADETMAFDVVSETWARTKLEKLKVGDRVNLERALLASGRFDGHVVQGHVEGVASVLSFSPVQPNGARLTIMLPDDLAPFVVEKGSIALDGVSLTVARLEGNACTVALIPETMARTTLGLLRQGEGVNVETDILGRYRHSSSQLP